MHVLKVTLFSVGSQCLCMDWKCEDGCNRIIAGFADGQWLLWMPVQSIVVNKCCRHHFTLSLVHFGHPITQLRLNYAITPQLHYYASITLLRYADKCIVNIMKVYIGRNNLQLELIRYRKQCGLYSRLLLRSVGFSAISPSECISGSFVHKPVRLRFWQSKSTHGRKKVCHRAYFRICSPETFRDASINLPSLSI